MQKPLIITALILFLVCNTATISAQPSVSSVAGNFIEAGQVAISGTGFGVGPDVVVFDDFEGGDVGQNIMTGSSSATIGGWNDLQVTPPKYSNAYAVSGTKAMRADQGSHWMSYAEAMLPNNTTEVFISWWMLIPPGDKIPGIDSDSCINWKTVWLQGSGTADDDMVLPVILGPGASANCQSSLGYALGGNDTPYTKYIDLNFVKGQWIRVWTRIKGGANNTGAVGYWELDASSGVKTKINDVNVSTFRPVSPSKPQAGAYERVHINGYGRTTQNSHPTFDDVYIASGPNAQARIEIGNNSVYTASTKLAILTPVTWSSNAVTTVMRQGVFRAGDSAFVFVINAAGQVSNGWPITIGGSLPPNAINPMPPSNLRVP